MTRGTTELGDITPHNIKQLKILNSVVFPVSYNDKFYKDVLEVGELAKLGSGTFVNRRFHKNDFLLEYSGELISLQEGERREKMYPPEKGSFLFFFDYANTKKCVDATSTKGSYGRMVNDGVKHANCKVKVIVVQGIPRLCLFATRDINENEELRFNYGVNDLPWRKQGWEDRQADIEDVPRSTMITDTSQKDEFIEQMGWEDRQADIEDVPRSTMITDTSQKDEFIEQMGWEDRQAGIEDVPRSTMITDTSQMDEFIEQMIHNDDDDGDFEDDDDKNDEYVPDSCDSDSEDDEIDQFESTDRPSSKRRIRTYPNLMQRYKKPARKCPYCSKYYVEKLTRHITTVHKDMKAVTEAMELPKKERDRAFDLMRKEGILLANKQIMKSSTTTEYQRERNTGNDDPLVMCAICKGFFSSRFFSRHKLRCQGDSCLESCPVPVSLMVSEPDTQINLTEFKKEILCKFRHDDVGETCRNDPTIVTIGKRLWDKGKAKENKKTEVRKSVMSDMRRLASLYKCFKEQSKIHSTFEVEESGTSQDMFRRRSFNVLIEAIHSYTSNEGKAGVKSGLKLGLYYLLKKASKVIKATHLMEEKDSEASEIDKFISVLELNYNFVFGDAMYQININRQKNLRKPAALPVEDDVHKLRNYTLDAMASMVNDEYAVWDSHRFSKLRNLTVSRLTLFNARRGGEPSRMSLEEWQQASSNAWIDKQKASLISDPLEKHLLNDLKITYQAGKGNNHLVPILFPADCIAAMELLTCKEVRATAGVKAENQYVFACTQTSSNHVSGWHAMNGICDDANVVNKSNLTATKNRHRISTIYASFDLPENERTLFFKHMGHSAEINENIYQAPAAVMEVTRVGKQLQHIDNNQHMREELWNDHDESSSNEDQHMREELWNDHDESSSSEGKKRKYKGSSSDKRNSKNEQKSKLGRPYTKWGKKDATKVAKYFNDIITGQSCKTIPAYYNDIVVGAVCCRIDTTPEGTRRMYIMTLGCLAPYRRLGIGTVMLKHVLDYCERDGNIDNLYLHVQVNNESAIDFYKHFGFEIIETKKQYYKRIEPAEAHVLQKTLTRKNEREAPNETSE